MWHNISYRQYHSEMFFLDNEIMVTADAFQAICVVRNWRCEEYLSSIMLGELPAYQLPLNIMLGVKN